MTLYRFAIKFTMLFYNLWMTPVCRPENPTHAWLRDFPARERSPCPIYAISLVPLSYVSLKSEWSAAGRENSFDIMVADYWICHGSSSKSY